jgi:reverse gyrase
VPSLQLRAAAELELRRRRSILEMPKGWNERIPALFGRYFWFPFSAPHDDLWTWEDGITLESSPRPFVAIWPRGRGKSTTTEAVVADVAIRGVRTYCLYVCATQDQADKHVATIARMLESDSVARYAPNVGNPKVSQNGNRTWNRKMVTTATGFTVEAIGLDKAVRGQKIDWARPDLIVFDDIDEKHDS